MTAPSLSNTPFKHIDERTDTAPPHPGEILREDVLPHFEVSIVDVAWRTGLTCAEVEALLNERSWITPDIAVRLATAFGLRSDYWLALQLQFDLWQRAANPVDTGPQFRRRPVGADDGAIRRRDS